MGGCYHNLTVSVCGGGNVQFYFHSDEFFFKQTITNTNQKSEIQSIVDRAKSEAQSDLLQTVLQDSRWLGTLKDMRSIRRKGGDPKLRIDDKGSEWKMQRAKGWEWDLVKPLGSEASGSPAAFSGLHAKGERERGSNMSLKEPAALSTSAFLGTAFVDSEKDNFGSLKTTIRPSENTKVPIPTFRYLFQYLDGQSVVQPYDETHSDAIAIALALEPDFIQGVSDMMTTIKFASPATSRDFWFEANSNGQIPNLGWRACGEESA